tara:strand:- start:456 stop:938 length:483 start_codon:yes stop_codon:yes gene_type:complete
MITLESAVDLQEVIDLLGDPELLSRIAEDGATVKDLKTLVEKDQYYLMIKVDGINAGVCLFHETSSVTLEGHINILNKYRKKAKSAGQLLIEWFLYSAPARYKKINAEIPVIYPEVYHYVKNHGFSDEGINRQSICKNGTIVDQWRLGLTRTEAQELWGH